MIDEMLKRVHLSSVHTSHAFFKVAAGRRLTIVGAPQNMILADFSSKMTSMGL